MFALESVPYISISLGVSLMGQLAENFQLPRRPPILCHWHIALHISWPKNSFRGVGTLHQLPFAHLMMFLTNTSAR